MYERIGSMGNFVGNCVNHSEDPSRSSESKERPMASSDSMSQLGTGDPIPEVATDRLNAAYHHYACRFQLRATD